jgi:signal transduction histidine kinase/FixJ family two-component response regulator
MSDASSAPPSRADFSSRITWLQAEIARLSAELQALQQAQVATSASVGFAESAPTSPQSAQERHSAIVSRTASPELDAANAASRLEWRRDHPDSGRATDIYNAFISNLSHELRTPMHALQGALYLLTDTALAPEQLRYIELIASSSTMLQSLIIDLLDFSAVHTGRLKLNIGPSHLLELVEAVVPMCFYTAAHKGVYLSYWAEPRGMLHKYVLDSARVEQIMLHLLSNAIKFTPSGGTVTMTIAADDHDDLDDPATIAAMGTIPEIDAEDQEQTRADTEDFDGQTQPKAEHTTLTIEVTDTGSGMSQSDMADLHRPFGAARQRSESDGLGVGLSVVWRLVEAMHGSIACDSRPGIGTTVRIALGCPKAGPSDFPTTLVNPFGLGSDDRSMLAKAHILIVTPDHANAKVWARLLGLYNARVHCAANFEDAQRHVVVQDGTRPASSATGSSAASGSQSRDRQPSFDILLLDGYHELTKRCGPGTNVDAAGRQEWSGGVWPKKEIEALDDIVRKEVSRLCRLLLIFVHERPELPDPESRAMPLSLLSLVARVKGERISCSMRPVPGEPLAPIFEGSIRPARVSPVEGGGFKGSLLLTAELLKPFNHRPFLCKVSSQLQRLPLAPLPGPVQVSQSSTLADGRETTPVATPVHPSSTARAACAPYEGGAPAHVPAPHPKVLPPRPTQDAAHAQLTPQAMDITFAATAFKESPMVARIGDLRLLVVDDSSVNLKLMTMFLRKLGCANVRVARNGVECLDVLREEGNSSADDPPTFIQCILMDINMDVMNGKECTRHIRTEAQYQHGRRSVYIIAQTANCTASDRASFLQCGMDDYLSKPISITALTAALLRAHHHLHNRDELSC